jgi:hypothetical protein
MFAKDIVVANPQPARLAVVFQILRRIAEHAPGMDLIVTPNRRHAREIRMRPNDAVRPHFDTFVNHRIWADLNGRV